LNACGTNQTIGTRAKTEGKELFNFMMKQKTKPTRIIETFVADRLFAPIFEPHLFNKEKS
jgi:hypothetical protein